MSGDLLLNLPEVEYLDGALGESNRRSAYQQPLRAITIGALGELVCWGAYWSARGRLAGVEAIRAWARQHGPLKRAWCALRQPALATPHQGPLGCFEVRPVPAREALHHPEWNLFLERFGARLVAHGFPSKLSRALSGAMGEMVDNVVSHSATEDCPPAAGIVAVHVEDGWMAYAVADCGRGVLASLATDPRHASVTTARAALQSAILEGATCRRGVTQGEGYRTVMRALSERNGYLSFRSGDAKLELTGTSTVLVPSGSTVPFLPGLQLVVHCSLDGGISGERWLNAHQ